VNTPWFFTVGTALLEITYLISFYLEMKGQTFNTGAVVL
jgi:hypothetical protein